MSDDIYQSHRWKGDKHNFVIRADIPVKLKKNERKLGFIKRNVLLQIALYPYMKRLQKERNELLSEPDFLWMLQQREEQQGNWRGWYDGLVYNNKYHYFIIDDHGPLCMTSLDKEFRVDLFKPIIEEIFSYRQIRFLKALMFLAGIYLVTFLITFGICAVMDKVI